MKRRTAIVVGLAGIGVGVVGLPFLQDAAWVGSNDLVVKFIVLDKGTGRPVSGAHIRIDRAQSSLCHDRNAGRPFQLVTDENGVADRRVARCMTFGRRGLFKDTYHSHVPHWRFMAAATGYRPSDARYLEDLEFVRLVRRGPKASELTVVLRLTPE